MSDEMPERKYFGCRSCAQVGQTHCQHPDNCGQVTEYIRADIYHKELAALAIESKDRELALARLEGEVHALRKLCSDRSCNHAWDREWRDDRTGRVFRNCVICGVKVEMP